jgi:hypothetical protein
LRYEVECVDKEIVNRLFGLIFYRPHGAARTFAASIDYPKPKVPSIA